MISQTGSEPTIVRSSLLSGYTTLGVGGPADHFALPSTIEHVRDLVLRARSTGASWRVLGRGSNLVIDDAGVDGYVLHLSQLRDLEFRDDGRVVAGAGLSTARLLAATRARGLGGLECLVGYPASVGGVARMNAGGRWGFAGDVIESVVVVDEHGEVRELDAAECGFAYRQSGLGDVVVVAVCFRLPPVDVAAYRARVDEIHRAKSVAQPLDLPSAGCVFKNPDGESAGRLVDRCGLKGRRRGGAGVSELHGNFVVNHGGATAADVLGLIDEIQETVERETSIRLELEVEIWRRSP